MKYIFLVFFAIITNSFCAPPKTKLPIAISNLLPDLVGCQYGCPVQNQFLQGNRIVGGGFADKRQIFYQCAIIDKISNPTGPICGCTIYNEKTVITAAHCCKAITGFAFVAYNTNKICLNLEEMKYDSEKIANIIIHPSYNTTTVVNDICILIMENKLKFNGELNDAHSIDISTEEPIDNSLLLVSGWGLTNKSATFQPSCLKILILKVFNRKECKDMFGNSIDTIDRVDESTLCAIDPYGKGQSICSGDSGGPLAIWSGSTIKLLGVVSKGTCGGDSFPAIFASVPYLKPFILSNKA